MINPEMITLAREDAGLTQRDLSDRLKISPALLSRIEAGLREVSIETIEQLAMVLSKPKAFFEQKDAVYGIGNSLLYHRKRKSISARALGCVHAQINTQRMHLDRLLAATEIDHRFDFPSYSIDDFDGGATEIAAALRAAWMLPRGPVRNMTALIEDAGGIVVGWDFPSPLIDAVSHALPGKSPLFFFNKSFPGDRVRRSLAHEVGHVVMHRIPNPRMEQEAEEFASEFLMPASDIRPSLRGLTLEKLAHLKLAWKVSMSSLLRRAYDVGAISERQYELFWMNFGKRGWRTHEPPEVAIPMEEPTTLKQLVDYHRSDLKYSWEDLSGLLNATFDEVVRVYGAADDRGGRLRAI